MVLFIASAVPGALIVFAIARLFRVKSPEICTDSQNGSTILGAHKLLYTRASRFPTLSPVSF